jgi:hypothetical protein
VKEGLFLSRLNGDPYAGAFYQPPLVLKFFLLFPDDAIYFKAFFIGILVVRILPFSYEGMDVICALVMFEIAKYLAKSALQEDISSDSRLCIRLKMWFFSFSLE